MFYWEMFLDEVEEEFANIGFQVFVVWWVEPDDLTFSVSVVCGLLLLVWLELQLVGVPRSFKGFLVKCC